MCFKHVPAISLIPFIHNLLQFSKLALVEKLNVRILDAKTIGVSIDETTSVADVDTLFKVCGNQIIWLLVWEPLI